jgi:hypothetical protein
MAVTSVEADEAYRELTTVCSAQMLFNPASSSFPKGNG